MTFKLATMCSGIGSPEQAIRELGVPHQNVFACEKDKYARQTYLQNFTPGVMLEDMTNENWDEPELYADLVVADIPCQSFSLAGKRHGENDPRGLLIYDFIRYVKKRQPKVFIIENVKGLLSDDKGRTFGKWLDLLGCSRNGTPNMFVNPESLGYNLHYRVLNCKDYGLPQNRERIFIIGIRPDLDSRHYWPKKERLTKRLIDVLETEVDEKYYLKGHRRYNYINKPLYRNRIITKGNILCPTILSNQAKKGSDAIFIKEGDKIRSLTELECMRLQCFSDNYIKPCSSFQTYKQAGNSIPVNMMKAILRNLLPILAP